MKAFVPYDAKEIPIRKLCRKLQDIGTENLPLMIRITQLAEFLSTTDRYIVNLCKKLKCPIVKAGTQKIRMVSRKTFFDRLKGGE